MHGLQTALHSCTGPPACWWGPDGADGVNPRSRPRRAVATALDDARAARMRPRRDRVFTATSSRTAGSRPAADIARAVARRRRGHDRHALSPPPRGARPRLALEHARGPPTLPGRGASGRGPGARSSRSCTGGARRVRFGQPTRRAARGCAVRVEPSGLQTADLVIVASADVRRTRTDAVRRVHAGRSHRPAPTRLWPRRSPPAVVDSRPAPSSSPALCAAPSTTDRAPPSPRRAARARPGADPVGGPKSVHARARRLDPRSTSWASPRWASVYGASSSPSSLAARSRGAARASTDAPRCGSPISPSPGCSSTSRPPSRCG